MSVFKFLAAFSLAGASLAPLIARDAAARPKIELPDGLELVVAAEPPLLNYPIMGTIDERGRLFVGDAAGLNLRRKELEEQLPNRVLMLEDTNGDGIYDKSTVFADRMTFPQGACWLDGSLYVASPPGIWKLSDTNGDGVADEREMIVGGFDYDGNAADVHGPFLHPTNGRLYWCHGRKGHKVVQKDGTLVDESRASGVWSCNPDGTDVQWHSLGSMDNPVEVDFTPEGEIIGVVNLYYNQPRGDTLMHWLYGGVYERPDQLQAIAHLPRTLERMPVVHNFGFVAVSGFTRYRSGALNPAWKDNLFVTYFNTQKLVRMQLTHAGATYQASEHEFLKLNDPDVHFTDVIEDGDGTLLVLDTGGWFRLGCPSSLTSKPDFRGAIHRIRKKNSTPVADPHGLKIDWAALPPGEAQKLQRDARWMVRERAARIVARGAAAPVATAAALLDAGQPKARLRACETIAQAKRIEPAQREALLKMLAEPLEPTLEHAAMFAAIAANAFDLAALRQASSPALIRRLMIVIERSTKEPGVHDALLAAARIHVDSPDPGLARTAVAVASRHPRAIELCYEDLSSKLAAERVTPGTLRLIAEVAGADLAKAPAQTLITAMLRHENPALRQTAWRILAQQPRNVSKPEWLPPLEESLAAAVAGPGGADLLLLLDAIGRLRAKQFDPTLRALATDERRPQPIRLRALAALSRPGEPMGGDAFALLLKLAKDATSATARVDAVRFLTQSRLSKEQLRALAELLPVAGPVELIELLKLARRADPDTSTVWAESFARSPVFGAVEESAIRSGFSSLPPGVYDRVLAPAVRAATEANDAKRRKLEELSTDAAKGRIAEGRKLYEASSCVACHKVGELGRVMGPDLSRIGQIRQPRDLIESILLPNATIARDFETYVVETADGQSHTGTIKSDGPEGLVLIDLAGQEKTIPHARIIARSAMPTSLMPAGLEQAFTDQQLLDMVAWLASLK